MDLKKSQTKQNSSNWQKEDKIAVLLKWLHSLFLGLIVSFVLWIVSQLDVLFALMLFAGLGIWFCMIVIEFLAWKTWWKYLAILFLLTPTPVGIIVFFFAYADARSIARKAGYSLGLFGPNEITLAGKKIP